MKKQSDCNYVPDWQIMNYSETAMVNNQETDGIEEEKEHRFYSSGSDGNYDHLKRKETKQISYHSPM